MRQDVLEELRRKLEVEYHGLADEIHRRTWKREYWKPGEALALSRRQYRLARKLSKTTELLNARSSTYYSAAGHAKSQIGVETDIPRWIWNLVWYWRAYWCLLRAVIMSDHARWKLGLRQMTAEQLDVRASILRKVGRRKGALRVCNEVLERTNLSTGTRCLTLINLAEIHDELGDTAAADKAMDNASIIGPITEPKKRVRWLRAEARYRMRRDQHQRAAEYFFRARTLAAAEGLDDQIDKINKEKMGLKI